MTNHYLRSNVHMISDSCIGKNADVVIDRSIHKYRYRKIIYRCMYFAHTCIYIWVYGIGVDGVFRSVGLTQSKARLHRQKWRQGTRKLQAVQPLVQSHQITLANMLPMEHVQNFRTIYYEVSPPSSFYIYIYIYILKMAF